MAYSDMCFMDDDALLAEIVSYARLKPTDVVLEVGAGAGNLTAHIAANARVVALEKDALLFSRLKQRFGCDDRVEPVQADFLKAILPSFNKVVSNIPYSISRDLIENIIIAGFEVAVLVVQKEFAYKLAASPGFENYRMLSVLAQSSCDVEVLKEIPASAFRPKPRVSSAVVRLTMKRKFGKEYIVFLNRLFSQKNKKVRNIFNGVPEEYADLKPKEMGVPQFINLYDQIGIEVKG